MPAYAAAKGALGQLTKALSNEWSKENVQVNGIVPGYIATDMYVLYLLSPSVGIASSQSSYSYSLYTSISYHTLHQPHISIHVYNASWSVTQTGMRSSYRTLRGFARSPSGFLQAAGASHWTSPALSYSSRATQANTCAGSFWLLME